MQTLGPAGPALPEAVGRRAVFYLPGFDPREPETYWGLFRREARLTAERRGLPIAVGEPRRSADGISLDWSVRLGETGTAYSLLRWDSIVRARFPRPEWRRLVAVPALMLRLSRSGYARQLRKEGRRFARVIFGVHRIYLAFAILSLALAACGLLLVPAGLRALALPAIPLAAYAILALLTRLTRGKPLYVAHLVDDTAFTHEHAAGRTPEMPARLDAFAARIAAAEAAGGIDEIVVVGHSSSSFLGIEVLDRILAQDPAFGTRIPVSFVTLGSVIPWIALDPAAERIRAALARVAAAPGIAWLDVRASWDWLSIHLRDPLTASGIPASAAERPAAIRVRIEDLIEPRIVARRRWNLFRMHFQLLMSSRRTDAFDYIAFVAGPDPVRAMIERCRRAPAGTALQGVVHALRVA